MIFEKSRITVAAAFLSLILSFPAPAALAKNIKIEAIDFSASHNISLTTIGASPYGYLMGLDYKNEWVEYEFSLVDSSANRAQIYLRGWDGTDFHMQMTVTEDGTFNIQTFDFYFTGAGLG